MHARNRGFTAVETAAALLLVGAGGLFWTHSWIQAQPAVRVDAGRRAVATRLYRLLTAELSQTSTEIDRSLPPRESQRFWLVPNGVRFHRVIGVDIVPTLGAVQQWSPEITYVWSPGRREVTRSVPNQRRQVVATDVVRFEPTLDEDGRITIVLATGPGDERHTGADRVEVVRITPRNSLK